MQCPECGTLIKKGYSVCDNCKFKIKLAIEINKEKDKKEKKDSKTKKINNKLILRILLPLFIVACLVVGIFFLANYVPSVKEALIQATTKKLETFTELYFEDHLSLPREITLFKENSFKFTIHNIEDNNMEYPYEVYIEVNGESQTIDKGSILIKNNEYKTITQNFIIGTPIQRVKIVVNLTDKNQQIHFWMGEE